MFSFQIFIGSRRELVANSIHTADADATQLNSTVESRQRRRCVLGIRGVDLKKNNLHRLQSVFVLLNELTRRIRSTQTQFPEVYQT